ALFYSSGYFRPAEKVTALLDWLLEFKPSFDSDKLKKEMVYHHLFDEELYDDTKMRLLISDALKVVNQFIAINKLLSDPFASALMVLDHFSQKENNEFTLKRLDEYRKKLDTYPFHSTTYYYWLFRLEELKNNYH